MLFFKTEIARHFLAKVWYIVAIKLLENFSIVYPFYSFSHLIITIIFSIDSIAIASEAQLRKVEQFPLRVLHIIALFILLVTNGAQLYAEIVALTYRIALFLL